MPVMNGFDLSNKMKTVDSEVPSCFITAFEDYRKEFEESYSVEEEVKCFIRKPNAIEDLVKHVATILG
jgi:response regulator RpfG family c-di-GMP phosphodiesterase